MRLQQVDSLLPTRTRLIESFAARQVHGVTSALPGVLIPAYWDIAPCAAAPRQLVCPRGIGGLYPEPALKRRGCRAESPPLSNVFAGNMSRVGPRPHARASRAAGILLEHTVKAYTSRHRAKPGTTGLMQINGFRGETTAVEKIETRVEIDLEYIENRSVWFDPYILLRTVAAVLFSREAF